MRLLIALSLFTVLFAGCATYSGAEPLAKSSPGSGATFEPHALLAIPDSGINPYHELYFRPDRVDHPCTYVENFPCDIPALNLSVGLDDWDAAYKADENLWNQIEPDQFYWIPKTVFVAVMAEGPCDGVCILDDTSMHGTGTTSSAVMENPDVLIAFKEGGSSIQPFIDAKLPVDIFSVSWGFIAPIPTPEPVCLEGEDYKGTMYIKASGNEPGVSTLLDCWSGKSGPITVGGAYAEDDTQEVLAYKEMDVVSYYCRPTAQTNVVSGLRESYCGTSFSAPTVAGALSLVVLELRRQTGYTGGNVGEMMVPDLNITRDMIRDALNQTASYAPESQYSNTGTLALPLNSLAPYVQWGWGFFDALVANATIGHLLEGGGTLKSDEAVLYQETLYEVRKTLYG